MITRFPEFTTVSVASDTAPVKSLPKYFNQHALILEFLDSSGDPNTQAHMEAEIDHIEVVLKPENGKEIVLIPELTPAVIIDTLMDYPDKQKSDRTLAGQIRIPWVRPRIMGDSRATSLGMLGVEDFRVKIDWGTISSIDSCRIYQEVDDGPKRPLGQYVTVVKKAMPAVSATGEYTVDDIWRKGKPGLSILGYHIALGSTPGVISKASVRINGTYYWHWLTIPMQQQILHRARRTLNADYFTVPLDHDGIALKLDNVQDFEAIHNYTTTPGSGYNIYIEYLENANVSNNL